MIALTTAELNAVTRAAALLPQNHRDQFLRSVANRLADPANGGLGAAITFVLASYGVAAGRDRRPLSNNKGDHNHANRHNSHDRRRRG
jgi:hypothetical protein